MSVEIHAALIGGAFTGAIVLLGIVLDNAIGRRSQRRTGAQAAMRRLVVTHAQILSPISELNPDQSGYPMKDLSWGARRDEVLLDLETIRQSAWIPKKKAIENAADDVLSITAGLTIRFAKSGWSAPVTLNEMLEASERIGRLSRIVVGERKQLDEDIRKFIG
jgi:hypothetical protein